jgi:Spy/CpxP family protein refolding chaperone
MRRTHSLLLATAIVAALPGVASAYGPGDRPGRGPGFGHGPFFDAEMLEERLDRHADRMARALDLTADQRAALDALRADRLDAVRPKLERMRDLGGELRSLLDAADPDPAVVGARVIELHGLRQELRAERETFDSELAKILTDEQRFAWDALREARGFGHDGPGGPGFRRR